MKKTLLLIALLLILSSANNLEFDLKSVNYSKDRDCWNVDIPVIGGSGNYNYQFDLPQGWRQQGSRIKIPNTMANDINAQYVARCRVKDTKNNLLERSLVFKPFNSGSSMNFQISDREYFYGHPSLSKNTNTNVEHGFDVLKRLGSLTERAGPVDFDYSSSLSSSWSTPSIGSSNSGYSSLSSVSSSSSSSYSSSSSSSFSSSINSFPSMTQLQRYISGGDIVEIVKAIQVIVSSNAKCEVKSAYLSDFLGKIYASIEVKKFALKELKSVVEFAVSQVQKLTLQITTIKSKQDLLQIKQIQSRLDKLIIRLRAAYDEYNKANTTCQYSEKDILILEQEITEINKRYSQVQYKLQCLQDESKKIDVEIAEYQLRIKKLRERKLSIDREIEDNKKFIKERDVRILEIKNKITLIRSKMSSCTTDREKLKSIYVSLEIEISSVKEELKSAEAKYSEYEVRITSLTVEIERYRKQTSDLQIKQVSQCIENLESAISQVKQSIEFVSYYCVNGQNVQIIKDRTDNKQCYVFEQNNWFNYIDKSYNSMNNLADQIRSNIMRSFDQKMVEISTVNVFSDKWKNNYGSCFQKDIETKAVNYKDEKSWAFSSDFSCAANVDNIETKSGVIQNISASSMRIRGDDGRDYDVKLGSCSKFEGQGKDFVPRKGQNALWKGSRNSNSYNLHTCTCF